MLTAAHVFKLEHRLRRYYGLTPRQLAVLAAAIEAPDFFEAGDRCGIKAKTARSHLSRVYRKLGVKTKFACYRKIEELFDLCS